MASLQMYSLQAAAALTSATNNGTSQNLPAKAKKLLGHINVSVCNAATTVTGSIQHSPDGTNWYDYIVFTNIVGTTGTEAKLPEVSDQACFQNVRSTVTLSGSTKSATVAIDVWFENF